MWNQTGPRTDPCGAPQVRGAQPVWTGPSRLQTIWWNLQSKAAWIQRDGDACSKTVGLLCDFICYWEKTVSAESLTQTGLGLIKSITWGNAERPRGHEDPRYTTLQLLPAVFLSSSARYPPVVCLYPVELPLCLRWSSLQLESANEAHFCHRCSYRILRGYRSPVCWDPTTTRTRKFFTSKQEFKTE